MKKRLLPLFLAGVLSVSGFAGCGTASKEDESNKTTESTKQENKEEQDASNTPKYVFLFIGDGMSYPQVQLTNYFVSASKGQSGKTVDVEGETNSILENKNNLTMMDFDVAGSAQTYDSTSFAPDSASTATSIATGHKTWSGSINVSEDFSTKYETIAEQLKAQKDYKIGVISSVNLNHATPAAFYAHQESSIM